MVGVWPHDSRKDVSDSFVVSGAQVSLPEHVQCQQIGGLQAAGLLKIICGLLVPVETEETKAAQISSLKIRRVALPKRFEQRQRLGILSLLEVVESKIAGCSRIARLDRQGAPVERDRIG